MNRYFEVAKQIGKKYLIEIILITVALLLGVASFVIFLNSSSAPPDQISFADEQTKAVPQKMFAEIAGAVAKPGVYELKTGSRLNDLLKIASGLSEQADKDYFARNFNLAAYIQDQQKIYIPTVLEVYQGLFNENQQNEQSNTMTPQTETGDSLGKININNSSESELDVLPGVGAVTAQKIIDNRPYQSVDELLSKKVVSQKVFDSIKDQITVN